MRKHLYLIKKQKIKSWLKFWLLTRDKVNYILSEIVEGIIFNLQNTVKRYFKIFNIFGNSVQDGTPSPENSVPIHSVADDGTFTLDFEGQTENYNYTFITNPLRSLPNGVRDSLEDDGIHRRVGRVVFDGSSDEVWNYNGSPGGKSTFYIMVSDVINLSDNTDTSIRALCNKFVGRSASNMVTNNLSNSISVISNKRIYVSLNDNTITTGTGFKTWLSTHNTEVLYELAEEVIEPYTEEQQEQYDKIKELYTFNGTTNISSDDEVPPYLQIQYYMKGE